MVLTVVLCGWRLRELFELVGMLVGRMELLGVQHVYKASRAALVACFLLF